MYRKPARILVLALASLLVLAAAGCGGKKAASTTATTTTAAATTTTTAATTTAAAAATTTASSSTTTSTTPSTSAAGLGGLSGSCVKLAGLSQAFASALQGSGDTEKTAALLKQFADKTPSDIRPDFETLAAAFQKLADAGISLKPGQTPDAATIQKLTALSSSLDTAALTKAETNIGAWAAKNCHA